MHRVMKQWRWFVIGLCLFIAVLALHEKVAVYNQSHDSSSITSLKLWIDNQKVELDASSVAVLLPFPGIVMFLLFAVVLVSGYSLVVQAPLLSRSEMFEQYRFLRPPPILS